VAKPFRWQTGVLLFALASVVFVLVMILMVVVKSD
jgi:hypothetical protein